MEAKIQRQRQQEQTINIRGYMRYDCDNQHSFKNFKLKLTKQAQIIRKNTQRKNLGEFFNHHKKLQ